MFVNALDEVGGNACVQCAVSFTTKNIDVEILHRKISAFDQYKTLDSCLRRNDVIEEYRLSGCAFLLFGQFLPRFIGRLLIPIGQCEEKISDASGATTSPGLPSTSSLVCC